MAIDPKTAIWIADIKAWNGSSEVTIRVASGANFTIGGTSAVAAGVKLVMDNPSLPARTGFSSRNRVTGRGSTSFRDLVLRNQYGTLDTFRTYNVDGRDLQFYVITPGGEFNTGAEDAGAFTMDSGVIDQDSWTIAIRGWTRALEVPIQTTVYAGNNTPPTGLEGTDDLKGKPKPIVYGRPYNVPLNNFCVNPQKLIYQVADAALSSIATVRDGGLPLTAGDADWTVTTNGFSGTTANAIASDGAGIVLAVGNSGKIEKSTDYGATYSTITPPTADNLFCVAWYAAGGVWIIAGANGTLMTSATGATGSWTSRTSQFTTDTIRCIAVSSVLAIIGGDAGKASSSTNGTTWTSRTSQFSTTPIKGAASLAASFGPRWVFVGDAGKIAYSTDGTTWTRAEDAQFTPGTNLVAVAGGSNNFVLVGASGTFARSSDGVTWTATSGGTAFSGATMVTVAYGNGRFIASAALSFGPLSAISKDGGLTWKVQSAPASRNSIAYTGRTWVSCGSSGVTGLVAGVKTYATLTDLQDDAQAPDEGTYAVCFDPTGSYIRVGSPPFGLLTCDPVEGATSADRTHAQVFRRVLFKGAFGDTVNRLQRSAEFDNGTWNKTNITVTANNTANPIDGAVTADKVAATATAATQMTQSFTVPTPAPAALTYSIYIKKGTSATTANAFNFRNSTTATDLLFGTVNLDTGVTTITGGSGRFHATPVKGQAGWFRVAITVTSGFSAGNTMVVYAGFTGGTFTAGDFSFLYGAQAEDNSTASSYIPTVASTDVGGDWNANDIVVLDAAVDDEIGIFIPDGDRVNVADVIDRIASSARAMWFNDVNGIIRIKRLAAPSGSPFTTIAESQMEGMEQIRSGDSAGDLPRSRTVLLYKKNNQTMSGTEIVGVVDAATAALLGQQWFQAATAFDSSVITAHPLATFGTEETLLLEPTDASAEATSRQSLFGVNRYFFDVPTRLDSTIAQVEIGDVVSLASTRYGMGAGTLALVLGVDPEIGDGLIGLSVWM